MLRRAGDKAAATESPGWPWTKRGPGKSSTRRSPTRLTRPVTTPARIQSPKSSIHSHERRNRAASLSSPVFKTSYQRVTCFHNESPRTYARFVFLTLPKAVEPHFVFQVHRSLQYNAKNVIFCFGKAPVEHSHSHESTTARLLVCALLQQSTWPVHNSAERLSKLSLVGKPELTDMSRSAANTVHRLMPLQGVHSPHLMGPVSVITAAAL
jgi:hypothetical protein